MVDMEQTWEEYEEWRASLGENEDIPHHVQEAYKKALEKLQELSVYEAELVKTIYSINYILVFSLDFFNLLYMRHLLQIKSFFIEFVLKAYCNI